MTDILDKYPIRHVREARASGEKAALDMINGTHPQEWMRAFVEYLLWVDGVNMGEPIENRPSTWHDDDLIFMAGYIMSMVGKNRR